MRYLWTEQENEKIKLMRAQGMTYREMMPELPNRTFRAISVQGNKILEPMRKPRNWTKEEEEALILLREEGTPYKEIAEILGRSYSAVKTKGSYLITSSNPRPQSKEPLEVKKVKIFEDLDSFEQEFIETGQDFFRF